MQRAWAHINKYQSVAGPALKADEIILDKYFIIIIINVIIIIIIIIIIVVIIIIIIIIIVNAPFIILMASFGVFFTRISKQKCHTSSNFHCRRVGWCVGGECSYNGIISPATYCNQKHE